MDEREQRLIDLIERAFHCVEVGDGVSLHEANIIDNYGTTEERLEARAPDEKHDWRKLIADPDLARLCSTAYASLSFFDGAGLRFHLPACFSRAILHPEDEWVADMLESLVFQLTHLSEYQQERFAVLDPLQRTCAREMLIYLRDSFWAEGAALDQAIDGYWSEGVVP